MNETVLPPRDFMVDVEVGTPNWEQQVTSSGGSIDLEKGGPNIKYEEEGVGKSDVVEEERRKKKTSSSSSSKKPPRPPKSHSLDSADQKLIKELALLKRARIKKMKAKSASSTGNLLALIFTLLFFLVIISTTSPALRFHAD